MSKIHPLTSIRNMTVKIADTVARANVWPFSLNHCNTMSTKTSTRFIMVTNDTPMMTKQIN